MTRRSHHKGHKQEFGAGFTCEIHMHANNRFSVKMCFLKSRPNHGLLLISDHSALFTLSKNTSKSPPLSSMILRNFGISLL